MLKESVLGSKSSLHSSSYSFRAYATPRISIKAGHTRHRAHPTSPYLSHTTAPFSNMSSSTPITLSSLKFIKPATLAGWLRDPSSASGVAVIDVRDSDHVGGHIRGSLWVPTGQLDVRLPELLRTLRDKDRVVVHCMLSQQRGPKAALQYARAKAYSDEKRRREQQNADSATGSAAQGDSQMSESDKAAKLDGKVAGQEICVLEGGFGSWAQLYGEDAALTESFAKDLWE